tara:strand:- start:746 stop:934 length:189 start_codon:yes stop_codon:yes gene_type:complete
MSKKDKEKFNLNDIDSIAGQWKPSYGINWDIIQRMRFMNADAEIDPEDSYSKGIRKFKGNNK